jgi:hypothetical protein
MNTRIRTIFISLGLAALAIVAVMPDRSLAAVSQTSDSGSVVGQTSGTGSVVSDTSDSSSGSGAVINPLASDSLVDFLLNILDVLLTFAIPIIVLFIMYAGFLYVTARGEESQISKAHAALTWSVIGGVIILGAKLIIAVIQGTVNSL